MARRHARIAEVRGMGLYLGVEIGERGEARRQTRPSGSCIAASMPA